MYKTFTKQPPKAKEKDTQEKETFCNPEEMERENKRSRVQAEVIVEEYTDYKL